MKSITSIRSPALRFIAGRALYDLVLHVFRALHGTVSAAVPSDLRDSVMAMTQGRCVSGCGHGTWYPPAPGNKLGYGVEGAPMAGKQLKRLRQNNSVSRSGFYSPHESFLALTHSVHDIHGHLLGL